MKEAVSGILIFRDKVFCIKRNTKMRAFPGYTAFPGGKVDECDGDSSSDLRFINALKRELKEELSFNFNDENVLEYDLLATAITPSFNPYRFKTLFYVIRLKKDVKFVVDEREAASSCWITPKNLLEKFNTGESLMVPPMVKLVKYLCDDLKKTSIIDVSLDYDEEFEVPYIEPIKNIFQLMPLSKTFPPANRTNCFIIGDEKVRLLVDPSPLSENELNKLLNVANKLKFNHIFLTHHHPDHHEFAPDIAKNQKIPIILSKLTKEFLDLKYGGDYLSDIDLIICKDGDAICRYLGEVVYVKDVPGHDNGQIALFVESKKWFIVGDLIQSVGTVVVGGEQASMAKYFKSLEEVIALNPQVIFPSHGIALGGIDKLEKTLRHRKMREKDIEELLLKGYDDQEILKFIYPNLREGLLKYALSTIQCHIKKIQGEL